MVSDIYAKIREALEMGPTPGPWSLSEKYHSVNVRAVDGPYVADCNASAAIGWETKQANAALIAACDPDTIRELLAERDTLAAANERLKEEMEYLTMKYETLKRAYDLERQRPIQMLGSNAGGNDDND